MSNNPPVKYSTEKASKEGLRLLMAWVSEHVSAGYKLVNICNLGTESIAAVVQIERTAASPEPAAGLYD